MQLPPPRRGDRLLDREPGQLVPEGQPIRLEDKDAALDALVQGAVTLARQVQGDSRLKSCRRRRDDVKQGPCRRVEPGDSGKDRIADGRWHGPPWRSQHFGHEEWVAAGGRVETSRVDRDAPGEVGDRSRAQGRNVQPSAAGRRRQVADHGPEWRAR